MTTLRNKVQLIGNLGTNPEIVNFDSGKMLAKFSLATNDSYKNDKGEKITNTQWHNIVVWGGLAKIAENFLEKGKEVCVQGKINNRSYETKDGEKRYITEIICDDILMMGNK